jgi:hypothetical protein
MLIIRSLSLTSDIFYYPPFLHIPVVQMDSFEDHLCPACRKYFPTIRGAHSHLFFSKKCAWYKKGKLKQVTTVYDDAEEYVIGAANISHNPDIITSQESSTTTAMDTDMDPQEVVQDMEDDFHFIPLPLSIPEIGEPGPSSEPLRSGSQRYTSIQMEENEDQYHIESPFPDAGYVIKVDENLHLKWRRQFGHLDVDEEGDVAMEDDENLISPFAPFASELDWRVASWAIKDGIGHKSFDRLLSIPGVNNLLFALNNSDFCFKVKEKLGLSYNNIRGLHQIVDTSIPSRAIWQHKYLSFADTPNEKHLIQFRNPIQAIESLLSNPAHAKSMVFAPKKIYTSKAKKSRIYNEMWTGRWWNAVQVSCVT